MNGRRTELNNTVYVSRGNSTIYFNGIVNYEIYNVYGAGGMTVTCDLFRDGELFQIFKFCRPLTKYPKVISPNQS